MRHNSALPRNHIIYTIAVMGFIYTIHLVLPMYSNSSFLSLFASQQTVGLIYMLGSAVTMLGLLFVPYFIRKVGNYVVCMWLILIQIVLFWGLIHAIDARSVAIFFVLETTVVALIGFCFDIFLEVYSTKASVGSIRGMYMTTLNSAWVIAPLIGSMIIDGANDYRSVYIAALFMLFPLFYLVYKNFPRFKDPHYQHPSIFQTFKHVLRHHNHSRLFFINIILQVFYAWMVVYSPIYLNTVIGLSWAEIGIILTIMLLPFPLIQYPLGKLADRKYGEKEIMILGFALLGLSTIALALITSNSVWIWALALFMTRVGAAAAEIMIETYFFKTVSPQDTGMLGFFRITRSISYFLAPLITGIVFLFTKDQSYLFITLGLICLLAIISIWGLKDTK
jgi:MFS family permease